MHEMIKDRGYAVSDDEINMSLDAFRATYASHSGIECVVTLNTCRQVSDSYRSRSQLNFFTNLRDNPLNQIFVYFTDEKSVGVKTMRKCAHYGFPLCSLDSTFARLVTALEDKKIQNGIIVFPGTMTPSARKVRV